MSHVCAGAYGQGGDAPAVVRRVQHPGCAVPGAVRVHARLDDEGATLATQVCDPLPLLTFLGFSENEGLQNGI